MCATLIRAAIRAPSGDNTQPWRFVVDPDQHLITLELDETRDPTPMNSGQRMARLAVGAALENLLRAAEHLSWETQLEPVPPPALAAVRVTAWSGADSHELEPAIIQRVTNRRPYDSRPVPDNLLAELRRTFPPCEGVRTLWILEPERLKRLADLIGRSDGLMLGEPSMRRGFLENVRFDLPVNATADEGMPLGSLELAPWDRAALRIVPYIPNSIFQLLGIPGKLAASARRLVSSSSGLVIIAENAGTEAAELSAGRVMQRVWLRLTESGIAVQPMMSLAILESVVKRGTDSLLKSLGKAEAEQLVTQLREVVPELESDHVAFLARFGHAAPPTCRTSRLPLHACTRWTSQADEQKEPTRHSSGGQ